MSKILQKNKRSKCSTESNIKKVNKLFQHVYKYFTGKGYKPAKFYRSFCQHIGYKFRCYSNTRLCTGEGESWRNSQFYSKHKRETTSNIGREISVMHNPLSPDIKMHSGDHFLYSHHLNV